MTADFDVKRYQDFPSNYVAMNESIHARIQWRLTDVLETCQIAEAQRQGHRPQRLDHLAASGYEGQGVDINPLPLDDRHYSWSALKFIIRFCLVELPISSSASSCERPTRCGWCFTERPYTMACLKSSLIVR